MTILDIFKWGLEAVQRMHQDDDEVGSNGDHPRLLMERGMMDNCQSIYMIHSGIIALKAVIKPCSVISEHTLFFPYQWPSWQWRLLKSAALVWRLNASPEL